MLEVEDTGALTGAALGRIAADEVMPDDERALAESAVREDDAEAVAYLFDPVDLIANVPGVELTQASWSSEEFEYDPDAEEWDLDEEDDGDDDADGDDAGAESGRA